MSLVPEMTLPSESTTRWMRIVTQELGKLPSLATRPFTSRRIVSLLARIRHDDLVTLQELVESGKITAAIDREYALHEVPDAIRYVHSGQGRAKVVIGIIG